MTRRALTSSQCPLTHRSNRPPRKGEPVVTAIWMTVSAATFLLGVSLPCLSAIDSPLTSDVAPTVLALYAIAVTATCTYNRLRYGRVLLKPLPVTTRRRRRRAMAIRRGKRPLAVMMG